MALTRHSCSGDTKWTSEVNEHPSILSFQPVASLPQRLETPLHRLFGTGLGVGLDARTFVPRCKFKLLRGFEGKPMNLWVWTAIESAASTRRRRKKRLWHGISHVVRYLLPSSLLQG